MILVNLLPYHLRPVKRTPLPYIAAVALVLVALGVCASMFLGVLAEGLRIQSELDDMNRQLTELEPVVKEHNELEQRKLALADKVQVIQDILNDRKIWSEHLNRLAQLTPDNFWYSRIRLSSITDRQLVPKIGKDGKQVINKNTKQPEMETVTVKRPVLEVSGYVINDEQGRADVYQLAGVTSEDPAFSEDFVLYQPRILDTEFNGFLVKSFTLTYLIEQGGNG